MTTPLPFGVFSSELLPGETVQWTGRPNAAVILHKEDWGTIPFSLLWGGFAIFWLLGASGIGGQLNRSMQHHLLLSFDNASLGEVTCLAVLVQNLARVVSR
jgi:hypothetical protein